MAALFYSESVTGGQGLGLFAQGLRASIDPPGESIDLRRRQLFCVRGHLAGCHALVQQAIRMIPRDDRSARIATFQQEPCGAGIERTLQLVFLAVTAPAVSFQNGSNMRFEMYGLIPLPSPKRTRH